MPGQYIHLRTVRPALRLDAHWVVAPPGPSGPVGPATPHIRVLRHVCEQPVEALEAGRIGRRAEFPQKSLTLVQAKPGRHGRQALPRGFGVDADPVRAGIVGVEVLVRLVGEVLAGVADIEEGRPAAGHEVVRAAPPHPGHENEVLGTRRADRSNRGIGGGA